MARRIPGSHSQLSTSAGKELRGKEVESESARAEASPCSASRLARGDQDARLPALRASRRLSQTSAAPLPAQPPLGRSPRSGRLLLGGRRGPDRARTHRSLAATKPTTRPPGEPCAAIDCPDFPQVVLMTLAERAAFPVRRGTRAGGPLQAGEAGHGTARA